MQRLLAGEDNPRSLAAQPGKETDELEDVADALLGVDEDGSARERGAIPARDRDDRPLDQAAQPAPAVFQPAFPVAALFQQHGATGEVAVSVIGLQQDGPLEMVQGPFEVVELVETPPEIVVRPHQARLEGQGTGQALDRFPGTVLRQQHPAEHLVGRAAAGIVPQDLLRQDHGLVRPRRPELLGLPQPVLPLGCRHLPLPSLCHQSPRPPVYRRLPLRPTPSSGQREAGRFLTELPFPGPSPGNLAYLLVLQ